MSVIMIWVACGREQLWPVTERHSPIFLDRTWKIMKMLSD